MHTRMEAVRVLGIAGSLRAGSYNRMLLRALRDDAPEGIAIEVEEGIGELPLFNEDIEGERTPEPVLALRHRIARVDALLFVTPEYNATIPGVLKNAVDWASRPFGSAEILGKAAAVTGASSSPFGAVWAQDDLRRSLRFAGARVLDRSLPVGRVSERVGHDGAILDDELRAALREHLVALVELATTPPDDDDD